MGGEEVGRGGEKEGKREGGRRGRDIKHSLQFKALIHVLMRGEKEGRKKQARSNKQQGKATCTCTMYNCSLQWRAGELSWHSQCGYMLTFHIRVSS